MREGRSAVQAIQERTDLGFGSALSGVLPPLDASEFLTKKEIKNMGTHIQYAAIAAAKAFEQDAGAEPLFESDRAATIIGNDSSSGSATTVIDSTRSEGNTAGLGSGAVVRCMNSSPTINLGVKYKTRGLSMTVSAADGGGAHAIGLGWLMIKTGQLDRAIVGGCQELCWESVAATDALGAFSKYTGAPDAASRPFDRTRDGIVPSGGAAIFLIEELELARSRGATILGEIAGYAMTSDGKAGEATASDGRRRCIAKALESAGIDAAEIGAIVADASGSVESDRAEATAIHELFGSNGPPVAATKSMTGHEGWASGPLRTAYGLLMMRDAFIAPNINFKGFSEGEPAINVSARTREARPRSVLINTFGYGGTNACIILSQPD